MHNTSTTLSGTHLQGWNKSRQGHARLPAFCMAVRLSADQGLRPLNTRYSIALQENLMVVTLYILLVWPPLVPPGQHFPDLLVPTADGQDE